MTTEHMTQMPDVLSFANLELVRHNHHLIEVTSNTYEFKNRPLGQRDILLLSGPSGGGKDSLIRQIEEHPENMGLTRPIEMVQTCTTRSEIREHEKARDPHIRLTREEFNTLHNEGKFIESNFGFPTGDLYGSPSFELDRIFAANRVPLLRINHTGAKEVLRLWRAGHHSLTDINVVYAFIIPPDVDTLRSRLVKRANEDGLTGVAAEKKADSRYEIALKEIEGAADAHFILINHEDSLDQLRREVVYNILPKFKTNSGAY